uniref:RWD domain-containing protein 2B n=1 Tax=Pogona vitticeps TaxID=103695 RepID=A0A6J0U0P5_9SAUR
MSDLEEAELQLSELDLLSSMFPNEDEFKLIDQIALSELKNYVERKTSEKPSSKIQFVLNVELETPDGNEVILPLFCAFPLKYPGVLPDITIRSPFISRSQQVLLNAELIKYLEKHCAGEVCILSAREWIKDHAAAYISKEHQSSIVQQSNLQKSENVFTRLWIYSHHIYNKQKRKNIIDWSKELSLSGFSMPGKPGIICVEGPQSKCEEFWSRIRRLSWQRILIRHREDISLEGAEDKMEDQKKFSTFEEKIFDAHGSRGNHMDLGQLYHFLLDRGCADIFQLYFGVEGQ